MSNEGSGAANQAAGNRQREHAPLLSEAEMLNEEEKFLWPRDAPKFRAGLALSGGGIRAATVALGVLQSLAERDLLKRFHYLSTVSGGGYIGSSLSWFWCKKRVEEEAALLADPVRQRPRFGAEAVNFPFQDAEADQLPVPEGDPATLRRWAVKNLEFLRNHGSYLTSGDGIGFAGLIIAVVRTILLSLAVWLPLLVSLFGIFEVVDFFFRGKETFEDCVSKAKGLLPAIQCRPSYEFLLMVASVLVLIFFYGVVLFSFLGRLQLDSSIPNATSAPRRGKIAFYFLLFAGLSGLTAWRFSSLNSVQPIMGVELTLLPLFSAAFLMLALAELFSPENRGYFLRRSFEKYSGIVLPNVLVALFVGFLPFIVFSLKPDPSYPSSVAAVLGPLGGVVTLLSGVGTALYGYYLKAKSLLPGVAGQIFTIAGSLLFLSGLLLFSFVLAGQIFTQDDGEHNKLIVPAFLSLLALALSIGLFASVNTTGLHRFYRDRLMETFMPMAGAVKKGTARQSDVADNLSVADMLRNAGERANRPYHLVNAHAILVNDDVPKVALRGGDNFLMSSAFVGSSATGWMRTSDYVRYHGALTLASAMAVSGAATNANAGYIGTGVTRDRFVSAVMSLLNIRLGLWVGNPKITARAAGKAIPACVVERSGSHQRIRTRIATYFHPVLTCGIMGFGHHRDAKFLELSDGGHFENLGLYELVRRRLDLIVVVDAEQDRNISLAALVSSTNRIKEDFGVSIGFLDTKGPEILLGKESDRYPSGVRIAKSPFVAARILYPDGKCGALIYIKSNMVTGLEFSTEGYRAANPDFPHQSTLDQFFDPDQFEAYRDLGRKSCAKMIDELSLVSNFGDASKVLTSYGFPSSQNPMGS
jgi:Patatin-like phospholipase